MSAVYHVGGSDFILHVDLASQDAVKVQAVGAKHLRYCRPIRGYGSWQMLRPYSEASDGIFMRDKRFFERIIALFLIAGLFFACLQITAPFLRAFTWATIMAVSTWSLFLRLRHRLGERKKLAATVMALILALAFLLPGVVLVASLTDSIQSVAALATDLTTLQLPDLPSWVTGLPLVGERITSVWQSARMDMGTALEKLQPYIIAASQWLLAEGAQMGLALLEFLLAIIFTGILYVTGESITAFVQRFATRVGGESSLNLLPVAVQTIRSVAFGVIGTALIQAILSVGSFVIAGVPGVAVLGLFCFVFAMLQIGTGLVWLPLAIWLAYQDQRGWAIFIVVSGLTINIMDNFIKPYLISRQGAGIPTMLIFIGVLGGLIAWGFLGIFLGATLLAIGYTVLHSWLSQPAPAAAD
jgi:predicted PurR-regulated permease PerM